MEFSEITGLIGSIGFPIAMCLILIRYIQTTQKELIQKMGEISSSIAVLVSMTGREIKKNEDNRSN